MATPQSSSLNSMLNMLSNNAYNAGLPDSTLNQLEALHSKAAAAIRNHSMAHTKGDYQAAKSHLHHAGENIIQASRLAGAGHMIPQIHSVVGSYR